jgi:hypothetical protein
VSANCDRDGWTKTLATAIRPNESCTVICTWVSTETAFGDSTIGEPSFESLTGSTRGLLEAAR